jgi:hypothetical protein
MTSPDNSPQSPGTAAPEGGSAHDPARLPASDAVRQAHADERFSRAIVEAANRAAVGRRSAVIIGSVIAVGVVIWLIVTRL